MITVTNYQAMALSLSEARRKAVENDKRGLINRAIYHQNRIRFHTVPKVEVNAQEPLVNFFAFVENILPHDKVKMFKALFRYPIKTNEITAICFDKLSRVFSGRNPSYNYEFTSNEHADDWEAYRSAVLNEPDVWRSKGWEYFKTEINSVLIVDLPEVQESELPEPYFYWLPISCVKSFETHEDGSVEWIAFKTRDNKLAVIDDETYRLFDYKNNVVGELLIERTHGLGYTPARFFWDESFSIEERDLKKSPITNELDELDWFLFYHISKRHLDLYGSYPIYSGYEQDCNFSNEENGDRCDGGFLVDAQGHYKFDRSGSLLRCPKCGDKRIIGAGSFVEVPIPTENQPDLRNPIQVLTVDRNSLDYTVGEEERLKNEIITSIVGTNEQITTRDALNEQQIRANFESQNTVLYRIKRGFESAQKFVDETICRLRYGSDAVVSVSIDYGTDFFLFDENELRNQYKNAIENGSSEAEVDALYIRIIDTTYRNNPQAKQRMLLLADIEPFIHQSRSELLDLFKAGLITQEQLLLKLNFASYINRFERENMNIMQFGLNTDYNTKIKNITDELMNYAAEDAAKLKL